MLLTGFAVVLGFNVVIVEGKKVVILLIVSFGKVEGVVIRLTGTVTFLDGSVVARVILAGFTVMLLGRNVVKDEEYRVLLLATVPFAKVEGVVRLTGKVVFIDSVRFRIEELNVDKANLIVEGEEDRVEFIAED